MLAASRGVRAYLAPPLLISFESVILEFELYLSTASALVQIGCDGVPPSSTKDTILGK
jgi:hypothetical protein